MNKTCARCQRVVYPLEELKCLDKTWHKTCFKCTECGMALNMKTYKGFNKLPYCEAHIPKVKATAIADTPELKRIAENTKIQSNVKYHADFEKAKGKFTQVADDPETLRIKQNTKIISNVAYHGDLEKKAAMEKQRGSAEISETRATTPPSPPLPSQLSPSLPQAVHHSSQAHQYQQQQALLPPLVQHQTPKTVNSNSQTGAQSYNNRQQQQQHQHYQQPQTLRPQQPPQHTMKQTSHLYSTGASSQNQVGLEQQQSESQMQQQHHNQQQQQITNNSYNQLRSAILLNSHHPTGGTISETLTAPTSSAHAFDQYDNYAYSGSIPFNNNNNGAFQSQGTSYYYQPTQQLYSSNNLNSNVASIPYGSSHQHTNGLPAGVINISNIGKIADYDPLTDGPRCVLPSNTRQSTTLIYSSDSRGTGQPMYPKQIGSVADIDPANGIYGSLTSEAGYNQNPSPQQQQSQVQEHQHYTQAPNLQHQSLHNIQQQSKQQILGARTSRENIRIYRALYDYEAQDTDEVSFREGDVIYEVDSIDSGWLTGRVERTGKTGMLPANYVEHADIK